jgi:hypothetical protein
MKHDGLSRPKRRRSGGAAAALIPDGGSPFINIGTATEDSGIGKIGPF